MKDNNKFYWKLLYDADCKFCTRFSKLVKNFDKNDNIFIISLQEYYESNQTIPLENLKNELHLVGKNMEILTSGKAVQKIISIIPAAKPIKWMIESKAGEKGSSVLYKSLSRFHRRCKHCH